MYRDPISLVRNHYHTSFIIYIGTIVLISSIFKFDMFRSGGGVGGKPQDYNYTSQTVYKLNFNSCMIKQ